jgi:hypothetical protein
LTPHLDPTTRHTETAKVSRHRLRLTFTYTLLLSLAWCGVDPGDTEWYSLPLCLASFLGSLLYN